MNGNKKIISTLGVAFLSMLMLVISALPASAKERDSRKQPQRNSRSRDRDHQRDRGDHRDRDQGSSRLNIGFRLGSQTNRRWVPGYYEIRRERVLVERGHHEKQTQLVLVEPGHYEVRHIPAVHKNLRGQRGKKHTVLVQPARTERIWVPPVYEKRKVKVWVPDRYEIRELKVWIPGHWATDSGRSSGGLQINLGGLFRF